MSKLRLKYLFTLNRRHNHRKVELQETISLFSTFYRDWFSVTQVMVCISSHLRVLAEMSSFLCTAFIFRFKWPGFCSSHDMKQSLHWGIFNILHWILKRPDYDFWCKYLALWSLHVLNKRNSWQGIKYSPPKLCTGGMTMKSWYILKVYIL